MLMLLLECLRIIKTVSDLQSNYVKIIFLEE